MKAELAASNKRIDNVNLHLAEQSRRIDETNKKIDAIHADLLERIDEVRGELAYQIKETNKRIDRLYEREKLERRIASLEREVAALKGKIA